MQLPFIIISKIIVALPYKIGLQILTLSSAPRPIVGVRLLGRPDAEKHQDVCDERKMTKAMNAATKLHL